MYRRSVEEFKHQLSQFFPFLFNLYYFCQIQYVLGFDLLPGSFGKQASFIIILEVFLLLFQFSI